MTGAASEGGIGLCIAYMPARHGVKVACTDIDSPGAQAAADEVSGLVVTTYIADDASIDAMVTSLIDHFGWLDIRINDAVMSHFDHAVDMPIEQFDKVFAVNVRGTFVCCRAAARVILDAGSGTGGGGFMIGKARF